MSIGLSGHVSPFTSSVKNQSRFLNASSAIIRWAAGWMRTAEESLGGRQWPVGLPREGDVIALCRLCSRPKPNVRPLRRKAYVACLGGSSAVLLRPQLGSPGRAWATPTGTRPDVLLAS